MYDERNAQQQVQDGTSITPGRFFADPSLMRELARWLEAALEWLNDLDWSARVQFGAAERKQVLRAAAGTQRGSVLGFIRARVTSDDLELLMNWTGEVAAPG